MVELRHHDAPNIQRQIAAMETRWQRFLARMEEHRIMLEASIEYHQLYEQVRSKLFDHKKFIINEQVPL